MVKIQVNSQGKAYYTSAGKVLLAPEGGSSGSNTLYCWTHNGYVDSRNSGVIVYTKSSTPSENDTAVGFGEVVTVELESDCLHEAIVVTGYDSINDSIEVSFIDDSMENIDGIVYRTPEGDITF